MGMRMGSEEVVFIKESIPLSYGGGGERWLINIANALKKNRVKVIIAEITRNESSFRNNVEQLMDIPVLNFGYSVIKSPKALFKELHARRYYYMPVYAHFVLSILLRRPQDSYFIVGHHNPWFIESNNVYDRIARKFLRRADINHCLSAYHARILSKYVNPQKIEVLANTFSVLNPELSIRPQKNEEIFEILFVGRLVEEKGVNDLPEVFSQLNLRIKDNMSLTIVGEGPLRKLIKKFAEERENVHFLGKVSDDKLIELYRRSHVVIMPSRYEASPLVLNEALSFGCAVVAYSIPPILDSIKLRKYPPRRSVKVVSMRSIHEMVNAIVYYYNIWKEGAWNNIEQDAVSSVTTLSEYVDDFSRKILKINASL